MIPSLLLNPKTIELAQTKKWHIFTCFYSIVSSYFLVNFLWYPHDTLTYFFLLTPFLGLEIPTDLMTLRRVPKEIFPISEKMFPHKITISYWIFRKAWNLLNIKESHLQVFWAPLVAPTWPFLACLFSQMPEWLTNWARSRYKGNHNSFYLFFTFILCIYFPPTPLARPNVTFPISNAWFKYSQVCQFNSHLPLFQNGDHSSRQKFVEARSVEKLETRNRWNWPGSHCMLPIFDILTSLQVFDAAEIFTILILSFYYS